MARLPDAIIELADEVADGVARGVAGLAESVSVRIVVVVAAVAAVAGGAGGCGTEAGRVVTSQSAAELQLAAKPVDVWVELDVACKGAPAISFDVELVQGERVSRASCNALDVNVKVGSVETTFGDDVKKRYAGKMKCTLDVPAAGAARVSVVRHVSAGCDVAKLDLVLKQ